MGKLYKLLGVLFKILKISVVLFIIFFFVTELLSSRKVDKESGRYQKGPQEISIISSGKNYLLYSGNRKGYAQTGTIDKEMGENFFKEMNLNLKNYSPNNEYYFLQDFYDIDGNLIYKTKGLVNSVYWSIYDNYVYFNDFSSDGKGKSFYIYRLGRGDLKELKFTGELGEGISIDKITGIYLFRVFR